MLRILPGTTNSILQVCFSDLFSAREIPRSDFGVNLHSRIGRNEVLWNIVAFQDGYATPDDCIVFPAGRGS